jgi:hypothetical protein
MWVLWEDAFKDADSGHATCRELSLELAPAYNEVVGWMTVKNRRMTVFSQNRIESKSLPVTWAYRDHFSIPTRNIIKMRKLR